MLETELAVQLNDLVDIHLNREQGLQMRDQLLLNFPVMSLEKEGTAILINLHELILQPSTLVSLLELHGCPKKVSQSSIPVQPTIRSSNSGESSAPRTLKHIGRPSVVSKYP